MFTLSEVMLIIKHHVHVAQLALMIGNIAHQCLFSSIEDKYTFVDI